MKNRILEIINTLGGVDAKNKYDKGWDDAINAVYNDVSNLPDDIVFTEKELTVIAFAMGCVYEHLEDNSWQSVMDKVCKLLENRQ